MEMHRAVPVFPPVKEIIMKDAIFTQYVPEFTDPAGVAISAFYWCIMPVEPYETEDGGFMVMEYYPKSGVITTNSDFDTMRGALSFICTWYNENFPVPVRWALFDRGDGGKWLATVEDIGEYFEHHPEYSAEDALIIQVC